MRAAVFAIAALGLAGCEHLYGGGEFGRFAGVLTPDLERRVVMAAARATNNEDHAQTGYAASVRDCGKAWCVRFAPVDTNVLDGGVNVRIDKVTGIASGRSADA